MGWPLSTGGSETQTQSRSGPRCRPWEASPRYGGARGPGWARQASTPRWTGRPCLGMSCAGGELGECGLGGLLLCSRVCGGRRIGNTGCMDYCCFRVCVVGGESGECGLCDQVHQALRWKGKATIANVIFARAQ